MKNSYMVKVITRGIQSVTFGIHHTECTGNHSSHLNVITLEGIMFNPKKRLKTN